MDNVVLKIWNDLDELDKLVKDRIKKKLDFNEFNIESDLEI